MSASPRPKESMGRRKSTTRVVSVSAMVLPPPRQRTLLATIYSHSSRASAETERTSPNCPRTHPTWNRRMFKTLRPWYLRHSQDPHPCASRDRQARPGRGCVRAGPTGAAAEAVLAFREATWRGRGPWRPSVLLAVPAPAIPEAGPARVAPVAGEGGVRQALSVSCDVCSQTYGPAVNPTRLADRALPTG